MATRKATQFYGGTSLFHSHLSENTPSCTNLDKSPAVSLHVQTSTTFPFKPHDETCKQLMSTFFKDVYEYNHCVYREYFLRDYAAGGGPYYSDMLMYSICAVGARISEDASLRPLSSVFLEHAEGLLLNSLDLPELTTLQSLIILGNTEIGQGRGSKGWLLCGMACRLTHEMGLHLDPNNWNSASESSVDREILRRVYWAVFIVDKQLSLYFGRPPALYPHEADVRNTIRIPYPPEWQSLLDTYISKGTSATALEDGISTIGTFVHQAELTKIFHRMITEVFENRVSKADNSAAATTAQDIHASLVEWLAMLPQKLHWNQWTVTQTPPYVLHLHMLFHTGMIILHRPPRQHLENEASAGMSEDIDICYESLGAILRLIRCYRKYYRFELLPLDFVHSLSAAAGVIMMKRYLERLSWDDREVSKSLKELLGAMQAIEHVWPCVIEIKDGILNAMYSDDAGCLQQERAVDFNLMDMLENGAGALPGSWFTDTVHTPADLGLLVTEDFLNGRDIIE
jgi:hypothetical protein